jgi:hypothetical protein
MRHYNKDKNVYEAEKQMARELVDNWNTRTIEENRQHMTAAIAYLLHAYGREQWCAGRDRAAEIIAESYGDCMGLAEIRALEPL